MIDIPTDAAASSAPADHSRYVQRIRRRYAAEVEAFAQACPGVPRGADIAALVDRLQDGGRDLISSLRVARQLVMERLAVQDIQACAPMQAITQAMTELAEVTLDRALAAAEAEADLKHGQPLNEQGQRVDFWVVGMGKLGGRELNVSSDIDLIYVYEDDGQTTGVADVTGRLPGQVTGQVSVHEYFAFVARKLSTLIADTTEDGFVFRVALALRPLLMPFVYRRYLDCGVFEGLRQLHRKIRDEAMRRAAGRPDRANDVKLARGGIREIEFTVQLLQVVRGGQFPEIRTRSTLKALPRLVARGLIPPDKAEQLARAYTFLRRVEHRIQFLDDQQTHMLPTQDADLDWIARSMGLTQRSADLSSHPYCLSPTCQLLNALCQVRELVATEFDALLHDGREGGGNGGCKGCSGPPLPVDSEEFAAKLPEAIAPHVLEFARQPKVGILPDASKLRLAKLIGRATQIALSEGEDGREPLGIDAVLRFVEWLNPLLRRDSYLSLLAERTEVLRRLLRLLGLARWSMRYLLRHPGVIDELADPRLMH